MHEVNLMLAKNLDLKTLYLLYKFLTNLDEDTRRNFHSPIIYPFYKNPLSLINYMRLFISTIISRQRLIKTFPRLACITVTAKSNHSIQGFTYLTIKRSFAKCYESELGIIVRKNFREKGIGNMLLKTLIDEAVRTDVVKITLNVLKDNIPAINLYRKHGFKTLTETEELFDGKCLNALCMELCPTVRIGKEILTRHKRQGMLCLM